MWAVSTGAAAVSPVGGGVAAGSEKSRINAHVTLTNATAMATR
jgi:hypothetical protein